MPVGQCFAELREDLDCRGSLERLERLTERHARCFGDNVVGKDLRRFGRERCEAFGDRQLARFGPGDELRETL